MPSFHKLLLPVALASCGVDTAVSLDTLIECDTDADCPDDGDWHCNRTLGRCQSRRTNLAPALSVSTPNPSWRPLGSVTLAYKLQDPNGDPEGNDVLHLTLRARRGDGAWCEATALTGATDLPAAAVATPGTLVWDALTDATACGLETVLHDGSAQLGFADDLQLALTAHDDGSPVLHSAEQTTAVVMVGNRPPVAHLELLPGLYDGRMAIPFEVEDDAEDYADIELQYRLPTDALDTWRPLEAVGAMEHISTQALWTGGPLYLEWDTTAALGRVNLNGVQLRMRAFDYVEDATRQAGEWTVPVSIGVRNQTVPQVSRLEVLNATRPNVNGVLYVSYVVGDAESDSVDVLLSYSLDGELYLPCTEYPSLQSEGRYNLATAPLVIGGGGVRHLFAWDVGADLASAHDDVRIRLQAADQSLGTTLDYVFGLPLGAENTAWPFVPQGLMVGSSGLGKSGDFDGDGIVDLLSRGGIGFFVRYGLGDGSFTAPLDNATQWSGADDFAVADFNGDGADDVALRDFEEGDGSLLQIFLGTLDEQIALTPAGPSFDTPSVLGVVRAGDLNDDGDVDLIVTANNAIDIWTGDGAGGMSGPETLFTNFTVDAVIADVDADGIDDLVRVAATHHAGMAIYDTPAALVVHRGQSGSVVNLAAQEIASEALAVRDYGDADFGQKFFLGLELVALDLDGDTAADLAVTSSGDRPRSLVVFEGQAGDLPIEVARLPLEGELEGLVAFDHDGNGLDDILVRGPLGATRLWLYRTLPGPQLDLVASVVTPEVDTRDLVAADLDGAETGDLVFFSGTQERVYLGDREGVLTSLATAPARELEITLGMLAAFDLDLDGVDDYLAYDYFTPASNGTALMLTTATDRGVPIDRLELAEGQPLPMGIVLADDERLAALADLEGDGRLEALVVDQASDDVYVVTTDVGPVLTSSVIPLGNLDEPMGLGDLSGDGHADLVVRLIGGVAVWMADGAGGFVSDGVVDVSSTANRALVDDVDRDGSADLVMWSPGLPVLEIAYRDGAGFTTACSPPLESSVFVVADTDADAYLDVAMVESSRIRVYEGSATRCAWAEVTQNAGAETALAAGVTALFAADLDGDGAQDLVGQGSDGVYFWPALLTGGLPDGRFGAPRQLTTGAPSWLTMSDADGDGWLDVVTALGDTATVAHGGRISPLTQRTVTLSVSGGLYAESASPIAPDDRFDVPQELRVARHPYVRRGTHQDGVVEARLVDELIAAGLLDPLDAPRAFTRPWQVGPATILRERPDGRTEVAPRFPAATVFEVTVPIAEAAGDLTGESLRMFLREETLVRADEWPGDPRFGEATAHGLLPRIDGRTVRRYAGSWSEVALDPDGLASGAGARFVVDGAVVRVRSDKLGVMVGFVSP